MKLVLARASNDANWQHKTLHKALDGFVCEDCIEKREPNTPLHRNFWSVGHQIATEILKLQNMLNNSRHWFCQSCEDTIEKMENG